MQLPEHTSEIICLMHTLNYSYIHLVLLFARTYITHTLHLIGEFVSISLHYRISFVVLPCQYRVPTFNSPQPSPLEYGGGCGGVGLSAECSVYCIYGVAKGNNFGFKGSIRLGILNSTLAE
jgi:hypothetical protein